MPLILVLLCDAFAEHPVVFPVGLLFEHLFMPVYLQTVLVFCFVLNFAFVVCFVFLFFHLTLLTGLSNTLVLSNVKPKVSQGE